MTISQLSDEQVSRWIAEKLEPKPVEWDEHLYCSPLSYWRCNNPSSNVRISDFEWQPRDMVNDPAMTVMLMLQPTFVGVVQQIDRSGKFSATNGVRISGWRDSPGRAVCEAWMLANGWREGEK